MLDRARIQAIVERHFRVYESREERMPGGPPAHLYFLMFPKEEFDARFAAVRAEILALDPDLLVFVRNDGGEDLLVVTDRPPVPPRRIVLHLVLFALTLLTTTMAGAILWSGFVAPMQFETTGQALRAAFAGPNLLWGLLTFALPLMLILGVHEGAHFLAARRHGLRATLPFFLPFPPLPVPIGTLGAFISLRDPLPDRRALFDVGASGPLAGFALAVPILLAGMILTEEAGVLAPDVDRPTLLLHEAHALEAPKSGVAVVRVENTSAHTAVASLRSTSERDWTYTATWVVTTENGTRRESFDGELEPGEGRRFTLVLPPGTESAHLRVEWDDRLFDFGEPLLVKGAELLGLNDDPYLSHPTFVAGWVGLLVTGINLLPAGQLDGGHVARALLGERMRYAAYATLAFLLYLGFAFPGNPWIFFALFILVMGVRHPPPLNDRTRLGTGRRIVAGLVLAVFAATFVIQPIVF